jgi:hypothetical protein
MRTQLSVDFLAFKTNGQTWGVDIAGGYDDTSKRLILSWHMHAPRAYPTEVFNTEHRRRNKRCTVH